MAKDYLQIRSDLDREIAQMRAEIKRTNARRNLLIDGLLSDSSVQVALATSQQESMTSLADTNTPTSAAVAVSSQTHSEISIHRTCFGVTTFPFNDPSFAPSSKNRNKRLLGIRFDIPAGRLGTFNKPYYVFAARVHPLSKTNNNELRIHKHTLPSFIPLTDYEKDYLSLSSARKFRSSDEGYASENAAESDSSQDPIADGRNHAFQKKQDLHTLVRKVRHDLVSWHQRMDAIRHLIEELGLPKDKDLESWSEGRGDERPGSGKITKPESEDTEMSDADDDDDDSNPPPQGKYGIDAVTAVSLACTQLRIIWHDGRVGRVQLSAAGIVSKAVLIGERGRMRAMEAVLVGGLAVGGPFAVSDLLDRLRILWDDFGPGAEDALERRRREGLERMAM